MRSHINPGLARPRQVFLDFSFRLKMGWQTVFEVSIQSDQILYNIQYSDKIFMEVCHLSRMFLTSQAISVSISYINDLEIDDIAIARAIISSPASIWRIFLLTMAISRLERVSVMLAGFCPLTYEGVGDIIV